MGAIVQSTASPFVWFSPDPNTHPPKEMDVRRRGRIFWSPVLLSFLQTGHVAAVVDRQG